MVNTFEDAALIIRELKERVDRAEEDRAHQDAVNVFRTATDVGFGVDTVTVTTDSAGSWTWGDSSWDHDEFG